MSNLKKLRKDIDKTDRKLLKSLAERFEITKNVGIYKKIHCLPPLDRKREKIVFEKKEKLAKELNLDPKLIKKIFKLIIGKVKENHKKIKDEK